jgi:hypothetical protein
MMDDDLPPELAPVDRLLRRARFEPRESLGPEVGGRVRRGEVPAASPRHSRVFWASLAAGLVGLTVGGRLLAGRPGSTVTIDRCCFDLDGGGAADDGVLVVTGRGQRVERLRVYEDVDRSGGWSTGDRLKFERGAAPILTGPPEAGAVATQCCLDWDGGGAADDGLMVVRSSPDRVVMAAIYETGQSPVASVAGWQLR